MTEERGNVVSVSGKAGGVRFIFMVTPLEDVLEAARKRGWTEMSDDFPHDVVDTEAPMTSRAFKSRAAAVSHATQICREAWDYWGRDLSVPTGARA